MNLKLTHELIRTLSGRQVAYHAAIEDVATEEGIVDHCFWDPPYAQRTQSNIRRGARRGSKTIDRPTVLGFDPADAEKRLRWAAWAARAARRWVLVFSDHESSMEWAAALERAGLRYVKCAIWVRTGDAELGHERPAQSGAPQFTADRPGSGHEVIVCAHTRNRKLRWNGRGRHGVYTAGVVRGEKRAHDTQKPLALLSQIVEDFMSPGESFVDAFCGAGGSLVAGKHRDLTAIGLDKDPKFATYAQRRADAAVKTPTMERPE